MMNSDENKLTKKDIDKVFWTWGTQSQICWNYETMQSGSVVLALAPALRKIYQDEEEYKKVLHSHFRFFNTQPYMGGIILGAALAVEEHPAEDTRDAVIAVKTGLMGPMAGVGDSIFFVIPFTIFGALAAYMGLDGSPLGIFIGMLYGMGIVFLRRWLFQLGYKEGSKFVTSLSSQLKDIVDSANILGLMVIGALIPSTVKLTSAMVFTTGEVTNKLQDTFDSIMPYLLPAVFVAFVYWLLGKKKMTSTKVIFIVIILAVIGYNLTLFS
jgi:PTS system mannose-specific IID component